MVMRETGRRAFGLGWILVLAACASQEPGEPPHGPESASTSSPTLQRLDGAAVALGEVVRQDRPVLLVFMTAWCPTCRQEQPHVERFARERAGALSTYFVISGSVLENAQALASDRELALELLVDSEGEVASHLEVAGTPTLILFDESGHRVGTYFDLAELPAGLGAPQTTSGVERPRQLIEDRGSELGTSYDVLVIGTDVDQAHTDLAELRQTVHRLEDVFSEWRRDSEISRLNAQAGQQPFECSPQLGRLLTGALHVSEVTEGAFDISWRALAAPWDRAVKSGQVPSKGEIEEARADVGWRHVRLDAGTVRFARPGLRLGIAGVAKGWIIDALSQQLRDAGYRDFVVNIGGDLRADGRDLKGADWRFEVVDPFDSRQAVTTLSVSDASVATSGNAARARLIGGRRYGHLLDPRTGWPADLEGSVTVVTEDAALADALATALFVMGVEDGLAFAARHPGVEALFVTAEGVRSTLPEVSPR